MPTVIKFTGADENRITVEEDPEAVGRALGEARSPARLTLLDERGAVYVNIAAVACWFERPQPAERGITASLSPF